MTLFWRSKKNYFTVTAQGRIDIMTFDVHPIVIRSMGFMSIQSRHASIIITLCTERFPFGQEQWKDVWQFALWSVSLSLTVWRWGMVKGVPLSIPVATSISARSGCQRVTLFVVQMINQFSDDLGTSYCTFSRFDVWCQRGNHTFILDCIKKPSVRNWLLTALLYSLLFSLCSTCRSDFVHELYRSLAVFWL